MPKWTVTIEHHETDEPCRVQFTTQYDGKAMGDARFGYPCDESLGFAVGMAMHGVAGSDDAPWLLASILNVMWYYGGWHDDTGMFSEAAAAIYKALDSTEGIKQALTALRALSKDSQ